MWASHVSWRGGPQCRREPHTPTHPPPQSAVTWSAPRATIEHHEAELTSPKLTGAFGLAINTSHTMAVLPVAQETSHL